MYNITRTLRFEDAGVRRAYYVSFWTNPRRLATISAFIGMDAVYAAVCTGLAQTSTSWLQFGLGGRSGAFVAAIFAWSLVTSAYFLFLYSQARLASKVPLRSGLLNPSGMGLTQQNLLLAVIFWPVVLLRLQATISWPHKILSLSVADKYGWRSYERASFLTSTTLGYGPLCAVLGIPAAVVLPQSFVIALLPVLSVWIDHSVLPEAAANVISTITFTLVMGAVTFSLSYAIALLPLLMFKTEQMERGLSRQRDVVMVRDSDILTYYLPSTYLPL